MLYKFIESCAFYLVIKYCWNRHVRTTITVTTILQNVGLRVASQNSVT